MTTEQRDALARSALEREGWLTFDVSPSWVRAERGGIKIGNSSWHALLIWFRRSEEAEQQRRAKRAAMKLERLAVEKSPQTQKEEMVTV